MPAIEEVDSVDARVAPTGSLENLSQDEVDRLLDSSRGGLYPLYRRCSLAVLNSGGETDDARAIFERYADFDISIVRQAWGVKLQLRNAPASAFVDGRMIRGIQEHLFAVLRDILYLHGEVLEHGAIELQEPEQITNAVYRAAAQRRHPAAAHAPGPRRLLGRSLDQPRGVRVHEEGRLRAGAARAQRLHRAAVRAP